MSGLTFGRSSLAEGRTHGISLANTPRRSGYRSLHFGESNQRSTKTTISDGTQTGSAGQLPTMTERWRNPTRSPNPQSCSEDRGYRSLSKGALSHRMRDQTGAKSKEIHKRIQGTDGSRSHLGTLPFLSNETQRMGNKSTTPGRSKASAARWTTARQRTYYGRSGYGPVRSKGNFFTHLTDKYLFSFAVECLNKSGSWGFATANNGSRGRRSRIQGSGKLGPLSGRSRLGSSSYRGATRCTSTHKGTV